MKTKRILAAAMCLCLCAPMTAMQTASQLTYGAEPTASQVFSIYRYQKADDHIEITAVSTMADGTIEVPSELDGLPVTVIGDHAFASTAAEEVILPDSISAIGDMAFAGSKTLHKVIIPDGIERIGNECFMNCTNLQVVRLPQSLKSIGVRAFYGCSKLMGMDIPDNVSEIGEMAFASCAWLNWIYLPDSLEVLETGVFENDPKLTKLTLPDKVELVKSRALPNTLEILVVNNNNCIIDDTNHLYNIKPDVCTIYASDSCRNIKKFASDYGFLVLNADADELSKAIEGYYDPHHDNIKGDANGDQWITVADLLSIQRYILGCGKIEFPKNADFNDDGKINVYDMVELREYLETIMSRRLLEPVYSATDLAADYNEQEVQGAEIDKDFSAAQTSFAVDVFKRSYSDAVSDDDAENLLVSPYSVMQALAMTTNGAGGDTLSQMEQALGGMPIDSLNKYLYTLRRNQPDSVNCKLKTANSIWVRDDVERVSLIPDFVQATKDYYDASLYAAPFDDTTVSDINGWVKDNTDGMIDGVIDMIPESAVMYLINAVAFDAKWECAFEKMNTHDATFTAFDGSEQTAEMMSSDMDWYIEDDNAKGFCKFYKGGRYAFAALLPDEGMSLTDYVETITPEGLTETIANRQRMYNFVGQMPKFTYDYDIIMNEQLQDMGMQDAFSDDADFSNMVEKNNVGISMVYHKAHIDVDELGTKAAAVTVVEVSETAVQDPPTVLTLNRPFVYCIYDTQTDIPVFIGSLSYVE